MLESSTAEFSAAAAAAEPQTKSESPAVAATSACLPLVVQMMLHKVRNSPTGHITAARLAAISLHDHHLQPIIETLHASSNSIETLDLSYNELTDTGAAALFDALESGSANGTGAHIVTYVHLGGNEHIGAMSRRRAEKLCIKRPELHIDWRPILVDAQPCCQVRMVYKNSPAFVAGMVNGDTVLQWGMLQKGRTLAQRFGFQPSMQDQQTESLLASCEFIDIANSISPLVRSTVGIPNDVIVRRAAQSDEEHVDGYVDHKLSLTPGQTGALSERWSGQGLLGCILK